MILLLYNLLYQSLSLVFSSYFKKEAAKREAPSMRFLWGSNLEPPTCKADV